MYITLSRQEADYILAVLAARPYNEVAALIPAIQQQLVEQLATDVASSPEPAGARPRAKKDQASSVV